MYIPRRPSADTPPSAALYCIDMYMYLHMLIIICTNLYM